MLLSELLVEVGELDKCKLFNEREFDFLSRITSEINGKRCIFLCDNKYIPLIPEDTSMVITSQEFVDSFKDREEGLCICSNPKSLYNKILNNLANKYHDSFETKIGDGCVISERAYIAPNNVIIGNDVVIDEFVCIYEGTEIGNQCVLRSGSKVGVQDYNYYNGDEGTTHLKHVGKTILKDKVEIGCNSVIGRALYEYNQTVVGYDTKIGSGVLIGHDSKLGKQTKIYANSTLGGNVFVGDGSNVYMGSTIKNAITIGKSANIGMGSVVIRNVADDQTVFGNPAKAMISPK